MNVGLARELVDSRRALWVAFLLHNVLQAARVFLLELGVEGSGLVTLRLAVRSSCVLQRVPLLARGVRVVIGKARIIRRLDFSAIR